ncbi:MAG: hypothetical protein GX568_06710 [Candidatus Gastranaerophilales bacterium]|jgi:hypothetical protein|nr:hypothetical protein [Candidatus Gastranaerophilales bacterium]
MNAINPITITRRPYIPPPEIGRLPINRRVDTGFKGNQPKLKGSGIAEDTFSDRILITRNPKTTQISLEKPNKTTKTTGNKLNIII